MLVIALCLKQIHQVYICAPPGHSLLKTIAQDRFFQNDQSVNGLNLSSLGPSVISKAAEIYKS